MHDSELTPSSIGIVPGLTHKALQAMATVLAILVVGLLFLAVIYLRQDRMLYFPAPATVAFALGGELP